MSGFTIVADFDRLHGELAEAVVACRVHADKRAVHSVRTGTRKLEAVLQKVLEDHPGAARLRKAAQKAQRELKRIRRAAGPVRDMDVHRELAEELRGRARRTAQPSTSSVPESDYQQLDRRLQRRRKRAAAELEQVLKQHEVRLEAALEGAAKAMAHLRAASPPALMTAREWARNSSMPGDGSFEDHLHEYRKQTKAARYLAGLDEASAPARRLVKRLKDMQDLIGRWHDLMLLTGEAAEVLGKRSALTRMVRAERNSALEDAARSAKPGRNQAGVTRAAADRDRVTAA